MPQFHLLSCTDDNLASRITALEGFNGNPDSVENYLDVADLPEADGFSKLANEEIIKTLENQSIPALSSFFVRSGFIVDENSFIYTGVISSAFDITLFKIKDSSGVDHNCVFANNGNENYLGCTDTSSDSYTLLIGIGPKGSILVKNRF